jgi:predicted Zn-dependent protease
MTARIRRWLLRLALLLALATAATLPACVTDPVTGEKSFGIDMTDEEEVESTEPYALSFKAQYEGAYPDAELQAHCEKIVLAMARTSHRPTLPWNFTILNSSEVNAFALPGGTVCITRGLLWRLGSEGEFAGVMGHEIGHVTHRHGVKAQGRQLLLSILLAGAAVGASQSDSEWAELGVALGAVGGQLLMLKYSRDQERQADERGVEYSYEAGYDPRELSNVFRTFKELKGGQTQPEWMSTHPLDDDRIAAVKRGVKESYPAVDRTDGAGLTQTTPDWVRLITRLRQDQKVYEEYDAAGKAFAEAAKAGDSSRFPQVLETLRRCQEKLPGHAIFSSGMGVVLYRMGQTSKARSYFEQAASQQPDLFEPHLYLAQIAFDAGDAETVHTEGKQAEKLFPLHPRAFFLRGRTYDVQTDYARAAKKYEQTMERAPESSDEYKYSAQRLRTFQARGLVN